MFICKSQFADDIDSLIKHLEFEKNKEEFFKHLIRQCPAENELHATILNHLNVVIKPSNSSSKIFTYRSSIVSLYGFLENFLEKLAEEFITNINEVSISVDALPNSVKERHLDLSMQLLTKVQRDRTKSGSKKCDSEKEVIKNLNSFLHDEPGYLLNSKAFTLHTANFRFDLIQSFFSQIGVDRIANRALNIKSVKDQLAIRQQQEPLDEPKTLQAWLELELDDLAQLRNEIAHGSFERAIESFELIIERADFIKCFGVAIADILYNYYEEVIFHSKERLILGNADRTFPDHCCFGFKGKIVDSDFDTFTLKVGDLMYAYNNNCDKKVISGEILSLRLNNVSVLEILFPNEQDFSIQVSFEVTSGMISRELSISKIVVNPTDNQQDKIF